MSKHLKPGVAVDVRGASDEDVQAVIEACLGIKLSMAKLGSGKGYIVLTTCAGDFFECDYSCGLDVISIKQALGRESEVEKNDWVPEVGVECEVQAHNTMWGFKDCDVHVCEIIATHGDNVWLKVDNQRLVSTRFDKCDFRPLKTERERFVERYVAEVCANSVMARASYDKGLRFTEYRKAAHANGGISAPDAVTGINSIIYEVGVFGESS